MIRTFFGSPGCGKTTLACKFAKKNAKKYYRTYCNFENTVPGCGVADLSGLGTWTFYDGSYIAVDEAGIEYNSRAYQSLPKVTIAWFKKHRHYSCDVDIFSQSWDDMDITLRRLTDELWYMYRLGPFTLCRRVFKRVTINKETEQIIDGYRMPSMLWIFAFPLQIIKLIRERYMLTFRPFYYKFFNSWEKDNIPVKDFPVKIPIETKSKRRKRLTLATLADSIKQNRYFVAFISFINKCVSKVVSTALSLYFKLIKRK